MVFGKKKTESSPSFADSNVLSQRPHNSDVELPPKFQNLPNTDVTDTTAAQLRGLTVRRHDAFKAEWDKGGVVQYKNEHIAILKRMWGQQVQFIVAYDQLTKEGYRLVSHDEGQEGSSGTFSGGINSYFYFQKIEFVR